MAGDDTGTRGIGIDRVCLFEILRRARKKVAEQEIFEQGREAVDHFRFAFITRSTLSPSIFSIISFVYPRRINSFVIFG